MRKKRYVITIIALFIILTVIYIQYNNRINTKISRDLEIKIPFSLKIDYTDNHGWFGDGTTLAKVKLTDKQINKMFESSGEWRSIPFTENVDITLYSGEKNGMNYGSYLATDLKIPKIKRGSWMLLDRFNNKRNFADGEDLKPLLSNNFSIGIIDLDTKIFYYIKQDI